MTTTLMQLRRLVRARLGVPSTDDFFTDDVIDDHINLAIDSIETEYRWPWQERVVDVDLSVDVPNVVLPADHRATHALWYRDDELSLISAVDLLAWTEPGGPPTVWAPVGNELIVRPVVSSEFTLRHYYQRAPTWLSEDDDTPDMPTQFAGAVVAKAAELLSNREDNRAAAAVHLADYQSWVVRMRRDLRRSTGPLRVRVRPGGWV